MKIAYPKPTIKHGLRVRSRAGSGMVIDKVGPADKLTVVGNKRVKTTTWLEIRYIGRQGTERGGWVAKQFLDIREEVDLDPIAHLGESLARASDPLATLEKRGIHIPDGAEIVPNGNKVGGVILVLISAGVIVAVLLKTAGAW